MCNNVQGCKGRTFKSIGEIIGRLILSASGRTSAEQNRSLKLKIDLDDEMGVVRIIRMAVFPDRQPVQSEDVCGPASSLAGDLLSLGAGA